MTSERVYDMQTQSNNKLQLTVTHFIIMERSQTRTITATFIPQQKNDLLTTSDVSLK